MKNVENDLSSLFRQYLSGTLSAKERRAFFQIVTDGHSEEEIKLLIDEELTKLEPLVDDSTHKIADEQADIIFQHITASASNTKQNSIKKYQLWLWTATAAATLILFFAGLYFFRSPVSDTPVAALPVANDVLPGKTGAILSLSNGKKILLDSLNNGTVDDYGNSSFVKGNNGIAYTGGKGQNKVSYHTLSTPRAYQYQVSLPDGTKVWLNAESSITYPTVFAGREREVTVTGETYFEVVENKQQPFFVHYGAKKVEVIGTQFNINTYEEEADTRVTLLQGKVKVYNGNNTGFLQPGQQAVLNKTNESIRITADTDTDQVMAWKNGHFDFRETDLKTLMRQLMRWYDVEVEYQKGVPQRYFTADISRNKNLSVVLDILSLNKIHFRIENKKIIVTP